MVDYFCAGSIWRYKRVIPWLAFKVEKNWYWACTFRKTPSHDIGLKVITFFISCKSFGDFFGLKLGQILVVVLTKHFTNKNKRWSQKVHVILLWKCCVMSYVRAEIISWYVIHFNLQIYPKEGDVVVKLSGKGTRFRVKIVSIPKSSTYGIDKVCCTFSRKQWSVWFRLYITVFNCNVCLN